ncbi:MAG: glycosyltransferase family 2 protein [Aquabacterium sp.]|uniref:glycosyltransferase family 2 protein n=1 Tax=Aquabacterium sp. TaxID=1872578 RepID=UPI003BBE2ABC
MTNQRNADPAPLRVAVVTPCWQESPEILGRCMASVRAQTYPVTHILVSDGADLCVPQPSGVMHIRLPFNIGNSGGTPRGLGAQLAFNLGFDAVAFLDADNWYDPGHIESAVHALRRQADVVFARRRVVFPDGEVMTAKDPTDESGQHVDTNCYVISRRAAFLMPLWLMWPKEFGVGEDRMMLVMVKKTGLRTETLETPTVWYQTNWPIHYKLQGKVPVAPLRAPQRSVATHFDHNTFHQLTGMAAPTAENEVPCGVGARQKMGLVVVDWRMRQSRGTPLHPIADLDLYVLPDDVPHPCDEPRSPSIVGMSLPRHRGYSGTAAGLAAALAFMNGCNQVVVIQGDWTAAQDELRDIYQRVTLMDAPLQVESVVLRSGESCHVSVFRRSHAYLALLYAQLLVDFDAVTRLEWLRRIGQWRAGGDMSASSLVLPHALPPSRLQALTQRTGLRLTAHAGVNRMGESQKGAIA